MDQRIEIECAGCAARDYQIVYPFQNGGQKGQASYHATARNFCREQVVQCRRCGLVYVNPRLPEEVIYNDYAQGEDPDYVRQAEARMATFRRSLQLIEKFRSRKPGKVLDIGAAAGFFLKAAQELGWETLGIEPNRWLANYAKNLGVRVENKKIDELELKEHSLDLVTLWDVLEHVYHPASLIQTLRRYLKSDGLLALSYPDIGTMGAKILGRRWWFMLDVHLYYFTQRTIRNFLEKNGFEVLGFKRLFQKLSLGYLSERMEVYSKPLGKTLGKFLKISGWNQTPLTYYAGQRIVFARPL